MHNIIKQSGVPQYLVVKYNYNGPRYTSYPTANEFKHICNTKFMESQLKGINSSNKLRKFGLYIHIPFCSSLCYYCACNKIITKNSTIASKYISYLKKEWKLYNTYLDSNIRLTNVHLGGGSPTFLTDDQLSEIHSIYSGHLISNHSEQSIEIDPRTVNEGRLIKIKTLGFSRISFGVQDLDPTVQKSINRQQSYHEILEIISIARSLSFKSINVDLIYGLPNQTLKSFERTLQKIVKLRPDRLSLYGYAHLPEIYKSQKIINENTLPSAEEKIQLLREAINTFCSYGYEYIGMDHFSLPNDELSTAKKTGILNRNFQGYTTSHEDIIGLGVSSISQYKTFYVQNEKHLIDYYNRLDINMFPIKKGHALSYDDKIRRAVIMNIMCHGKVYIDAYEQTFQINFYKYFALEIKNLKSFSDNNLIVISDKYIEVSKIGWFFIRPIAMVFDQYLRDKNKIMKFSKVV
jgi:oxygen-independent coproporphyrinogen III oxidase